MLLQVKAIGLVLLITMNSSFGAVSEKELIKGVFFGTGKVANEVTYIKNSYALKNKLQEKDLKAAEEFTNKLAVSIIKKNPLFVKDFTRAVNEKNIVEVLHHIEQADTILLTLNDSREVYDPNAVGVAVAVVAVVAVAVHNVVAVTSVAAVAVAVTVKVALRTTNDEDSLIHRERLAMELVKSLN
ncbi:hypothetical protein A9Q84_03095 [Halobacteriovorax marinus]|uniref:Secreted protein n=1 Tax=Halobacteriovorax marinus TaxID=97084 RepID=A0A1Y5FIM0_9BACT|nr:hypothetical protein A9Q84_03095 [Halobacteriovorax marinus]